MDITVHEEDVVNQDVQIGPQSSLTAEEKAKMAEVFSDSEPQKEPPKPEQVPAQEPEITADDLPKVEEPKAEVGRKFKVKIDGVESDVDEETLIKGFQLQSVATKRLQEAARIKAEAEAMREAMAFYQKPNEPVYTPQYQQPTGEFEPQTPTEKLLFDELQAIKGQVGSLAQARENDTRQTVYNKLDGEIKAFRDAHKDLNDEQFGTVLDDLNRFKALPSREAFETIYKARFTDPQKIRDEAVKEYTRVLLEKKKAAVAPSSESGAPQPPPDVRTMSDEQRLAEMAKMLS